MQGFGALAANGSAQQGTLAVLIHTLASQPGASSAVQDLASRVIGPAS